MNKFIVLSTIAALSTMSVASEVNYQEQIDELTAQVKKLQKNEKRTKKKLSKVNAQSAKDNIKFDVDFRTSYDNVSYESVNGNKSGSANGIFSNRLWLGMGYSPVGNMIFKGQLAYNKAFGATSFQANGYPQRGMGFDTFDWISNETLNDDKLRVREVFWLWTPSVGDVGLTMSVGRRPATNGFLGNLREDDPRAKSPLAHVINMEFDGASFGLKFDEYSPGLAFKVCYGRGLTNAAAWANQADNALGGNIGGGNPDYSTVHYKTATNNDNLNNVDLAGFIFVPYSDGQYDLRATWYRGFSVPGMVMTEGTVYNPGTAQQQVAPKTMEMLNTGDMDGMALSLKVEGIGDGINDFLDETTVFASYAMSVTHPNQDLSRTMYGQDGTQFPPEMQPPVGSSMLGSEDSETGSSYWIGAQMPNLTGGKFGLEYNHGSEYWRPFTYGEDTLAGSKMAVRGSAYEVYWSQPIVSDVFSMQIRYTYLDYDYTGSNGFFGDGGAPVKIDSDQAKAMDAIETASDLRIYLRYRY